MMDSDKSVESSVRKPISNFTEISLSNVKTENCSEKKEVK